MEAYEETRIEYDFESLDESDDEVILDCSEDDITEEETELHRRRSNEEINRLIPDSIKPYEFEPEAPTPTGHVEGRENAEFDAVPRTGHTNWCSCANCQPMPTNRESVCCQDVEKTAAVMNSSDCTCIISHPGFAPQCLNPYVLELSWKQFCYHYGKKAFTGPEHKRLRLMAYRNFTLWCWGFLGRHNRVVLPACVVSRIRAEFPPPGLEDNFQFSGFLPA